ncbi:MAG TPA: type II toxin-antitoxin system death-on-curing family toxin [Candidatus Omnitrophota bacterium]|nr:type II toxin-antitoxin system death-on-curing family toxin [Candidatus Omnitrophota bacterium]MDD5270926.1 type II toxin-antitoxin system death-on-curing family toxin [Candidatus Omnitrophota bacterium]HOX09770.1 type II toxin-antitoxin system death-on-curing family toxin [Candidatus Omnitrophota bacterium]HPN66273.1 type II toxin-antitoxin system death-on-curing family toxin [Candidatus Omnitrophota bacterium]HRZ66761.1 type II toxin-antitoxin system death-on-curing family toxin [Candidatu
MMAGITISEVEYVAFRLAKETMDFNEPIPAFSSRYPNILESCLSVPFQRFSGSYLYKGLIRKAAMLFYLMIKNHPFQNGNKRIAMTTLFVFLYMNKKWIEINDQELYNFAVWVASSPARLKEETIAAIEKTLDDYMVNLN